MHSCSSWFLRSSRRPTQVRQLCQTISTCTGMEVKLLSTRLTALETNLILPSTTTRGSDLDSLVSSPPLTDLVQLSTLLRAKIPQKEGIIRCKTSLVKVKPLKENKVLSQTNNLPKTWFNKSKTTHRCLVWAGLLTTQTNLKRVTISTIKMCHPHYWAATKLLIALSCRAFSQATSQLRLSTQVSLTELHLKKSLCLSLLRSHSRTSRVILVKTQSKAFCSSPTTVKKRSKKKSKTPQH